MLPEHTVDGCCQQHNPYETQGVVDLRIKHDRAPMLQSGMGKEINQELFQVWLNLMRSKCHVVGGCSGSLTLHLIPP